MFNFGNTPPEPFGFEAAQPLQPAAEAPLALQLPTPPPSIKPAAAGPKGPTIWDKQHISDTLLAIGSGFLSGSSFMDGAGKASQGILGLQRELRTENRKSTTIGGPDNQFAITTDPRSGQTTFHRIPEFSEAVRESRQAKLAPKPGEALDFRSRALHAITTLPPAEQAAAYADLKQNGAAYGVDTSTLPATWDPTFGAVAGGMGMKVNQSVAADQHAQDFSHKVQVDDVKLKQGDRRLDQGDVRNAQGDRRLSQGDTRIGMAASKLAGKAPPALKGISTPRSRADFEALPRGSKFMAPDGSVRIKQ